MYQSYKHCGIATSGTFALKKCINKCCVKRHNKMLQIHIHYITVTENVQSVHPCCHTSFQLLFANSFTALSISLRQAVPDWLQHFIQFNDCFGWYLLIAFTTNSKVQWA